MDFIQTILTKIGALEMKDWTAIAVIISALSLISSFLQPEIRKLLKRIFLSSKLKFISVDKLILFYNHAGSYARLNITIQPINDALTIKNISVNIRNMKTNESRILNWSASIPLFVQNFGTLQLDAFTEAAPERVFQDDIKTFKIEFSDTDNDRNNRLKRWKKSAEGQIKDIDLNMELSQIKEQLLKSQQITSWKTEISEDFFWKDATFSLEVIITDSLEHQYTQTLYFSISSEESKQFRKNIDEFFWCLIERRKNISSNFFTVAKNFASKTLEYKKP